MKSSTNTDGRSLTSAARRLAVAAIVIGVLMAAWKVMGFGWPGLQHDRRASLPSLDASQGRALPVNTLVAKSTPSYQQVRVYNGIVKARRSSDLSFARAGKLALLLAEQGQQVRTGDVLAELDPSRLTLQKNELERTRAEAKAALSRMIADSQLRSMESVRIEVRDLKSELNQIRQQIGGAENKSVDDETNPPQNARSSPQARLDLAQRRLEVLEGATGDPSVNSQQAVIAELDERLAQLDVELEQSRLVAPYDGAIMMRSVNEGMLVSPGLPIVRLVEQNALEVWIGIPAELAGELIDGESHVMRVGEQSLDATVSSKSPELDRSARTRTVVFSLDPSAAEKTLPGEVARIELPRRVESSGFWLPITALTRESRGLWSVYVAQLEGEGDHIVSRRYVEVIHLEAERVRVRGTLDDGEAVIAEGTHRVVPGQKVEPIPVDAAPQVATAGVDAAVDAWGLTP